MLRDEAIFQYRIANASAFLGRHGSMLSVYPLAKEMHREAMLYKLSTRVRGTGLHGEMSKLIAEAFDEVVNAIGKKRTGFLLTRREADAVASSREAMHSHQEAKAGTNTLIQTIDDLRKHGGLFVVSRSTNPLHAVDPAVTRRAAQAVPFYARATRSAASSSKRTWTVST